MERRESIWHRLSEGIQDMCYIWKKEMVSIIRDEGVFIFCVIVPLFYPLLYSWCYNNEVVEEVPVAVVDMSHSEESREFIRKYDASSHVRVAQHCNNLQDAQHLVGSQQVRGVLYFPPDFGTNLNRLEQSHVSVYCDMSLMLAYSAIYSTATAVSMEINKSIQVKLSGKYTAYEEEVSGQPLGYTEVPIFNPVGGYGHAVIPAVLILIIQQTLLLGIGMSAGTARENNRYRDLVPVSKHYNGIFRIVLGKGLCYFMIYAVLGAYLTMVVPRIFNFVNFSDRLALLGLLTPYILACIFFGMTMSCFIRYRENVILIVVFTSIPLMFMSGVSWPEASIPGFWKSVAYLFPSTFGVRGFVRINSMGANLADIRHEYQMLWVQVVVYFFTTCIVYRYQILHARHHAIERMQRLREKARQAHEAKEGVAS